jgi:nucleoside-diphosphate-sugar epimerase
MGYFQFIRAMLGGETIDVTGDGHQIRGNTYVGDCIAATVAAMEALPDETFNVGGGEMASVWEILKRLETIIGAKANTRILPARPGDQRHNFADTTKLRRHLGWRPVVTLDEGLARQVEWQRDELRAEATR